MKFVLPLDQMTREEKLEALELLWTDLTGEAAEHEAPAWHEDVVKERLRRFRAGETTGYTLEEIEEHFSQRG
ncbi:MAG: addiction module protein [Verrucomicrobiota bacterium JB022]|nr:addiction module protein [Verrucomicrobiota bacterium JB022]